MDRERHVVEPNPEFMCKVQRALISWKPPPPPPPCHHINPSAITALHNNYKNRNNYCYYNLLVVFVDVLLLPPTHEDDDSRRRLFVVKSFPFARHTKLLSIENSRQMGMFLYYFVFCSFLFFPFLWVMIILLPHSLQQPASSSSDGEWMAPGVQPPRLFCLLFCSPKFLYPRRGDVSCMKDDV